MTSEFTPEEISEAAHGPGDFAEKLPRDRLSVRRELARKLSLSTRGEETYRRLSEVAKAAYAERPPWKFYTDSAGGAAYRVYGVSDTASGRPVVHVASAHPGCIDLVVGGMSIEDLVEVDEWTPRQESAIGSCGEPGAFYDPLGFAAFACSAEDKEEGE